MRIEGIKNHLKKLKPPIDLATINMIWIEIVLERHGGNRSSTARELDISMTKIRAAIAKGIQTCNRKGGHPTRMETILRKGI
jgi:transcriptional regulator with PAS, ATPase and Fis domain